MLRHLSTNVFTFLNPASFLFCNTSLPFEIFGLSEQLGSLKLILL